MNNTVAALTWVLKDSLGEVLDVLEEPVDFFIGGEDLLPSIEQALMGKKQGERVQLYLQPDDAFGDYDESLVFLELRDVFPQELEEGMVFEAGALPAAAQSEPPPGALLTVTEIYPEHVVLDANHPLAGIALNLELHIRSVRPSTEAEQARRSAGAGFFRIAPPMPGEEDEDLPTYH